MEFISPAAREAWKKDHTRIVMDMDRRRRELASGRCLCGQPLAVGAGPVPVVRYTCQHAESLQ